MKALMKLKDGGMALVDIPEPAPGAGEVKVLVKATGICGTDLYGYSAVKPPVVLGHETAGEVVEVGEGVKRLRVGDRVTTETTAYVCGKCRFCQSGNYNLCPDLTEPLACATHAVMEQGKISSGDVVLVIGPGPLGLLVGQVAKTQGARVIICGLTGDEERLALAKDLGVDFALNLQIMDISRFIEEVTDGYGADAVFECAGAPSAVELGLKLVRKRGKYIQAGILRQPVKLNLDDVLFGREINLIGSHTQRPSSWTKALRLMREEKVNLKSLVTHQFPLTEWEKGFKIAKERNSIKVILYPEV